MRLFFLVVILAFLGGAQAAAGQNTGSQPTNTSKDPERVALATRPTATTGRAQRLACVPLLGQVFDPNGRPLVGATLLVKGTQEVYVTDSDGRFQLTNAIYNGQTISIGAAGYTTYDVALTDCTLPRLVLQKAPGARFKRSGKRAGQVTRIGKRSTNLR